MKRFLTLALVVSMLAIVLVGCAPADQFSGKWTFSKVVDMELASTVTAEELDLMKEYFNAEDAEGVAAAALTQYTAEGVFAPCYVNFAGKDTYTYDPAMDREATWRFYKTGENEGFLSFYTELDASEGNLDPINWPNVVYHAESNTITMTINYLGFMVTLELTK